MMAFTHKLGSKALLRIAALATAGIGLSGCTYDLGLGYASDGYGYGGGSGYYDCDPYSPFDNYYDCDNGYGFSNIGYGGGWYDNYWYPGYGLFLFDNGGRRYAMRDNHRRYWGERRHSWYRENRGRRDGHGGRGRGRGYSDNNGLDPVAWPERGGGRVREGDNDRHPRGDGRRDRNRDWQGGDGNGVNAIPTPTPEAARGEGRRGRNRDWQGEEGNGANAVPMPNPEAVRGDGRRGRGDGQGRRFRPASPVAEQPGQSVPQARAPEPVATPQPRAPREPVNEDFRQESDEGRFSHEPRPD